MQLNWPKTGRERRQEMMKEARELLRFSCQVYALQHEAGRTFLHEHPATASSWGEKPIVDLLKLDGIYRRELDMCRYNLRTPDENGKMGLVRKTTSVLTNSLVLAIHLARRCCGGHKHIHLKGGRKATMAALYTDEFCESIVEGYKLHMISEGKRKKPQNQKLHLP